MPRRNVLITLAVVAAFVALLLVSTLRSQKAECRVVVEFRGARDSAVASAATEEEAEHQARTSACGPIAPGMDQSIACTNTPPVRRSCRTL